MYTRLLLSFMVIVAMSNIAAMVAAETMVGRDDHKVIALPHDKLKEVLKKYNRLRAD